MDIPDCLADEIDRCLANNRERYSKSQPSIEKQAAQVVPQRAKTRRHGRWWSGVETCQNGQHGCCGPDGDDLFCFECFKERTR